MSIERCIRLNDEAIARHREALANRPKGALVCYKGTLQHAFCQHPTKRGFLEMRPVDWDLDRVAIFRTVAEARQWASGEYRAISVAAWHKRRIEERTKMGAYLVSLNREAQDA